jgi:plastocyanin
MSFNNRKLLMVLSLLILLLAACGTANPEANTTSEKEEPVVFTPSISVTDQDAADGSVTIENVTSAQSGWMVIHAEADGSPGPVIGFAQVQEGENQDVAVDIDLEAATGKLFAMLHIDSGTAGSYEFPGDDVPAKVDGAVVVTPFNVTLPETADKEEAEDVMTFTPSINVSDQDASGGSVTIENVTSAQLGWMVIHAEADGGPGPVIGYAQVQEGENQDVAIDIDLDAASDKLFAMLHIDAGTTGSYEFPGDDVPVKVDDAVVVTPFNVTFPDAQTEDPGEEGRAEVTVTIKDSRFDTKDITVKAGTTVIWVMDANFPHTVTADDGSFDSGRLSDGETFSFTFDTAGEFPYYCTIHGGPGGSGMSGTVTVTD